MGAGIQKRDGRDVARNAFAKAQRIEITHRLLQSRAVALAVVVFVEQLRNQQLAVMPIQLIEAVGLRTCRKLLQHSQGAFGLAPHQAVDGG